MKRILLITLLAVLLGGCRTTKQLLPSVPMAPVILNNSDSVKTEYIETVRIDTVTVEVPVPMESVSQVVRADSSHVETSLAVSDAWICEDGSLGHTISNKPQKLKGEALVPVKDTQTNKEAEKIREVPVAYPEPVYVEKKLTLWQVVRIKSFWYLMGIILILIFWVIRKPLISMFR